MKQMEGWRPLKVTTMLDTLNHSKRLYEKTADEQTRQKADRTFADCYDWFIQQDIAITYDEALHLWLFVGQYEEA